MTFEYHYFIQTFCCKFKEMLPSGWRVVNSCIDCWSCFRYGLTLFAWKKEYKHVEVKILLKELFGNLTVCSTFLYQTEMTLKTGLLTVKQRRMWTEQFSPRENKVLYIFWKFYTVYLKKSRPKFSKLQSTSILLKAKDIKTTYSLSRVWLPDESK